MGTEKGTEGQKMMDEMKPRESDRNHQLWNVECKKMKLGKFLKT